MENNLKVVFSIPTNSAAGAERVITTLANSFDKYGIITQLVMYDNDSEFYPINKTVKQFKLGLMTSGNLNGIKRLINVVTTTIKRYKSLKNLYEVERPDIIISFLFPTNIINIIVAKRLGIPIIVSERSDPNVYPKIKRKLVNYFYKYANLIVCQTDLIKNRFSGIIRDKTVIIKNPITKEQIGNNTFLKRRKTILHVGRLVSEKNQKLLIKAFSNVINQFPEYELQIYGDGPEKNSIEEYSKSLGVSEQIYFGGVIPNVVGLNSDASMFVLTSNVEGIPNTLIEAMANGIPAISTNFASGAALEIIEDGVNGWIIPMNDEAALTNTMLKIITYPDKAEEIAINGRRIQDIYNLENITTDWLNLIRLLKVRQE
jgi:GalNAc-alpha-(1->4)-GalNAc-alpha-(1->3)-diNAcBac-PP-undecaprenol alpha-1,4-N-acetyl-D-galactosaminyltransferase